MEQQLVNSLFEINNIKFLPYNFFEQIETNGTVLSSNSYRVVSKNHNKVIVLNNIVHSENYTLEDFVNELKKYKKVGLHENVLKFIGIIKQSKDNVIFAHEYAYDETLRQYLKKNFKSINWIDKLRLARQLVSAIKCLHENDIIHTKLHSKNLLVHKGDIRLNVFNTFQYQSNFSDTFTFIQYIDPKYLQNLEIYKLNKSSDIYSIGVLLWEISSGIIPFESELIHGYSLLKAIIRGKREVTIPGTPKKYRKIYIECWQHDQRPTIQNVFNNLNSIVYNDLFDVEENNENLECKENSTIESDGLNTTDLLQQHTNLQSEIEIELKLMSSIVETLKKSKPSLNEKATPFLPNDQYVMKINDDQNVENNDDQEVTSKNDDQEDMNNNDDDQDITDDQFLCDLKTLFTNNNDEPQFLYDLSKLFIDQFNIQGVSKGTSSSIIYEIKEYIDKNYKNPKEILVQYCNHQYRSCFTSIIGFFYEYGIGTDVNYSKAFEMYKEAADDSCFIFNDSSNDHSYFLKENQFIGLISLGSLYTLGKGIDINLQKAFQLFLKSVAKGSILAAEKGNARAQNVVGYSYQCGEGTFKDEIKALEWYEKSAEKGTSIDEKLAFEWLIKAIDISLEQSNINYCYTYSNDPFLEEKNAIECFNTQHYYLELNN
ncbi:kinase-like protein [Gigaspora margarita]|uniref:Kinase-like protein n=1 Tax=Gigaspora margarita TaxID=4874 RepID=A0A8H4AXZ6_GIGMA|nr:kinase-like protein [Gigaspora margarita]